MIWDAVWEQEGAACGGQVAERGAPRAGEDQGGWTQIPPAACLASHPEGLLYPLEVVEEASCIISGH